MLSEGIEAAHWNATRLVRDAEILAAKGAYASAAFLRAIADEEVAKVYMLLDMARVDFLKHSNIVRQLCKSYYDHIAKAVYIYISRHADLPGFAGRGMAEVQRAVEREKVRYWEGGDESGEPDMPHESVLYRELNLYSDYSEWEEKWCLPCDSSGRWQVSGEGSVFGHSPLDDTKESLEQLREAEAAALFAARSLGVIHRIYSPVFVDCRTTNRKLGELEERCMEELRSIGLTLSEELCKSFVLRPWPLYALI